VHFDNEVHLRKMHQKVHLAKMHRLYVGIRKNHMDQIKKNQKVHLAEMHFLVLFLKVGLFAPALVIDSVILSFFFMPHHAPPHTTTHNHHPTLSPCHQSQRPRTGGKPIGTFLPTSPTGN
jgi:hypothetical protein